MLAPLTVPVPDDNPLPGSTGSRPVDVDVVIPVYNEAHVLESSVRRLWRYLDVDFPLAATVTIVDNASTDGTWAVAQRLAASLPGVRALHLGQKGRGRALRWAWSHSDARVVAYMDVDLSTGLSALLPLVAPLLSGHSEVAIGSRLARSARVGRGVTREVVSRSYNTLIRAVVGRRFSDAQCGFKALTAGAATSLLPAVRDEEWFFDTELLIAADRAGMRIHEVPVDWVDDPDTRVRLAATACSDIRGLVRVAGASALRRAAAALTTLLAIASVFVALDRPAGILAALVAAAAVPVAARSALRAGHVRQRARALRRARPSRTGWSPSRVTPRPAPAPVSAGGLAPAPARNGISSPPAVVVPGVAARVATATRW